MNKKLTTFLRRLRFFLVLALLLAAILAVATLVSFRRFENRRLYHPSPTLAQTPHDLQLDFQSVEFRASDNITLAGWWIAAPAPSPPSSGSTAATKTWATSSATPLGSTPTA